MLSAIAKFPTYACIGIDEATAIIVEGNKITVTGESQVLLMQKSVDLKITVENLIKMKSIQFSIFTSGDIFYINQAH